MSMNAKGKYFPLPPKKVIHETPPALRAAPATSTTEITVIKYKYLFFSLFSIFSIFWELRRPGQLKKMDDSFSQQKTTPPKPLPPKPSGRLSKSTGGIVQERNNIVRSSSKKSPNIPPRKGPKSPLMKDKTKRGALSFGPKKLPLLPPLKNETRGKKTMTFGQPDLPLLPPGNSKKMDTLNEILKLEETINSCLRVLLNHYYKPLLAFCNEKGRDEGEVTYTVSNLLQVVEAESEFFYEMTSYWNNANSMSSFDRMLSCFSNCIFLYSQYAREYEERSLIAYEELKQNSHYSQILNVIGHR